MLELRHRRSIGFTLVEVLIALALAAMGFGVVLHSVGMQMAVVATSIERQQMLLYASQILETNLANGQAEKEVDEADISSSMDEVSADEKAKGYEQATKFVYSQKIEPVTSDPRVQEITVSVKGSRSTLRLSAYRVRVKRN